MISLPVALASSQMDESNYTLASNNQYFNFGASAIAIISSIHLYFFASFFEKNRTSDYVASSIGGVINSSLMLTGLYSVTSEKVNDLVFKILGGLQNSIFLLSVLPFNKNIQDKLAYYSLLAGALNSFSGISYSSYKICEAIFYGNMKV